MIVRGVNLFGITLLMTVFFFSDAFYWVVLMAQIDTFLESNYDVALSSVSKSLHNFKLQS